MTIPRVINQLWFQFSENSPKDPPPEYTQLRESVLKSHPNYEHKLWSAEEAKDFMTRYFPEYLNMYLSLPKEINRVDAFRYFLIAEKGGIVLDMDMLSLKSLDDLLGYDLVLVRDILIFNGINNGFFAAKPKHPLLLNCCKNLLKSAKAPGVMLKTGPHFLTLNYFATKEKGNYRLLKVPEFKEYLDHKHYATWTGASNWIQALNPERRQYMKPEDLPRLLKPFLKNKVGLK